MTTGMLGPPRDCVLQNTLSASESRVITQYIVDRDTVVDTPTVPVGYVVEGKKLLLLTIKGGPYRPARWARSPCRASTCRRDIGASPS